MTPELPADRKTAAMAIRHELEARKPRFDLLLPQLSQAERDKYLEVAILAILRDDRLQGCSKLSLVGAVFKSAEWGLPVDKTNAALVAYGQEATFVPMYRGLVRVCRRSSEIRQVWADVILEGEKFRVVRGGNPKLIHEPDLFQDRSDAAKVIGAYACARWKDGHVDFVALSRAELDKVKKAATSKLKRSDGPWFTWEIEQQKKTAVRRLSKLLPQSEKDSMLIDEDERQEVVVEGVDVTAQRSATRRPAALDDLALGEGQPSVDDFMAQEVASPAEEQREPVPAKEPARK